MNFDFTDDQRTIQSTAHDLLAKRFEPQHVRQLAETGTYATDVWTEITELGWSGIFLDEEHGGEGLGVLELLLLLEELGYSLAPLPFLSNAAAGIVLQETGNSDRLAGIAAGEIRGTVGLAEDGRAQLVPDADSADFVILIEDGRATLVERADAEIDVLDVVDPTRLYATVRARGGEDLGDVGQSRELIALAVAAELLGVTRRAMDMSVQYAKERTQFNRPIGAYQAISHRCAEMLVRVEATRSLVYYAGWAAGASPEDLPLAASMAKADAADAAWEVTASALQVHGGTGFTWEHHLHWFLKRARTDGALYGSARHHRERVMQMASLAGPPSTDPPSSIR